MVFDTNAKNWKSVAKMNDAQEAGACTVFEWKIVVCGGRNDGSDGTNTVEVYHHVADTWSFMTNMIERRMGHSSVGMKNKLFVIGNEYGNGRETYEVFDSNSKKFYVS